MPNHEAEAFDCVVIGAGAGGLFAASCLVNAGRSVLLVDDKTRLGGRATSYKIDGFTVNTGAIALKTGGGFEELLRAAGIEPDLREPNPRTAFRVDGKIVNAGKGGLGLVLAGLTKSAAKIGQKFVAARHGDLPEEEQTTKEWLNSFTRNKTVHGLFRNLCAVLFSVNPDVLPARAFLSFFAQSAATPLAFCPRGTIGVWEDLAGSIAQRGGEIRLETRARRIHVDGGIARAVDLVGADGTTRTVRTGAVISDAGVVGTIALAGEEAMGADYVERARRRMRPTTIFNYYFALDKNVLGTPAFITPANTERLSTICDMTLTCPELAPPGWHLYVAYSVPPHAVNEIDPEVEIAETLAELRREWPEFADARVLLAERMMGAHTCVGYNMEQETPVANLWNVGDSVLVPGDGGTQACAETGRLAAAAATGYLGAR